MGCDKEQLVRAGAYLRKLRKEKGLSLFKVARSIHISGNYLSELERGKKTNPSDLILEQLANFYDIGKEKLFSMYNRVYVKNFEHLNEFPELLKLVTKISSDKKLNSDEVLEISKELHNIYISFKNNKGE